MKRILTLLLALIMCISSFPVFPLTALAEDGSEGEASAEAALVDESGDTGESDVTETTVPADTQEQTKPVPAAITLCTLPNKTRYLVNGESLDLTGGTMIVYFNDGTEEIYDMAVADQVAGFDNSVPGDQELTLSYGGYTLTFSVTIIEELELENVELVSTVEKTEYFQGEELDLTGGKLKMCYNNDTSDTITLIDGLADGTVGVSGYDSNLLGDQEVAVTYGGFSVSFTVTVSEKPTLEQIWMGSPITKTEYLQGEALDLTGGTLMLRYSNDTYETVALTDDAVTVTGYDSDLLGGQTLTVAYLGLTTELYVSVYAYSGTCGDDLAFSFDANTGTLTITGSGAMYDYSWGGTPWFAYADEILTVVLPDTMTALGKCAFQMCTALKSINLPAGITSIPDSALDECHALTSLTIPDSVKSIGQYAFSGSGLTSLVLPEGLESIDNYAFQSCGSLQEVVLPDSLERLGGGAFLLCTALETVEIPGSVDTISWETFTECYSLKEITIPETVTEISYFAFSSSGLEDVTFDGAAPAVTLISEGVGYPFEGVTSDAQYPGGDDTWTDAVKQSMGGTLTWTPYYKTVASGTCGDDLTWNLSGDGVLTISGSGAMEDYSSRSGQPWFSKGSVITDIIIADGVTAIGSYAFASCQNLKTVKMADSVTGIGDNAFYGCETLDDVTLSNGLTTIGDAAFMGCTSLPEMTIPKSVTSIGEGAFANCTGLTAIGVEDGNSAYQSVSGVLYSKDREHLSCYPAGKQDAAYTVLEGTVSIDSWAFGNKYVSSVVLPDSITIIGEFAFDACSALEEINIPDTVTSIGAYAFNYCTSLKEITIPAGIRTIEYGTFYLCQSLEQVKFCGDAPEFKVYDPNGENVFSGVTATVYYPAGNTTWTAGVMQQYGGTITWKAYAAPIASGTCGDNLTWVLDAEGTLTVSGTGAMTDFSYDGSIWNDYASRIKAVVIEEGVTSIGARAFRESAVASVSLADSVTTIGEWAFYGCSSLRSIVIPASVTKIRDCAFYTCLNLTDITFGHSAGDYLYLEDTPFLVDSDDVSASVETIVRVPYTNDIHSSIKNYGWHNRTVTYKGTVPVPATSITLSADVTEVEAGLEVPLTVTMDPAHTTSEPEWSITGDGNAVVDENGVLIGTAPGDVTVRCSSLDDETVYAEIQLTILEPTADVSGISIRCGGEFSYELEVGQSAQMIADVRPGNAANKTVMWSVENGTGKATIDGNGVLTALTTGTVTVYATATDGTKRVGSQVIEIVRYVDDITILLNGRENVTQIGVGETMILSATVSPADASKQDVVWSVEDGTGSAKVRSGNYYSPEIEGISAGTVTLTAASSDSRKKLASVELTVCGEEASCEVAGGNIYYNTVTGAITGCDTTVTSADIPAKIGDVTITSIAPYAFARKTTYYIDSNTTLTSVTIPSTVTEIGEGAFYNCTALASVKLGSGLKRIGAEAFYQCGALTGLTIPEGVTDIGDYAFSFCNALTTLTMPGDLDPRNWLEMWNSLETLTLTGETIISLYDGGYYSQGYRNAKTVIISDSVTAIEDYAFYHCYNLTEVSLPDSLVSIGKYAFAECEKLSEINLPDSLTHIGKNCFTGSGNLQIIDLSAVPNVIMAKETDLTNKAGVPSILVSATGGETSINWYIRAVDEDTHYWDIADIYSNSTGKTCIGAYSTGTVILHCYDEYTGAHGSKEISIETGIELRGLSDGYLVSGQNVTLTSYRMPDNKKESVSWSLREEDKAYASISSTYGKTTKLTAKSVKQAVQVQLTATPDNGDAAVLSVWILPKATGVTIFEGSSEDPVGMTGMTVQTLAVDMHTSKTVNLSATMQPEGALETVTWKSSDTKIATVSKGVVTLKTPGTVTISATSADGTKKSASVRLSVTYLDGASKLTATAEVPSIGLQNTFSTTMLVYGTDKKTALDPADLIFSIPESQQKIATVDENGVITAKSKPGTAIVTAAIAGDPLNRKVSVKVKVIAAQTESLILTPEAGEPAQVVMLDADGNVTEAADEAVRYAIYLDKEDIRSGVYAFQIRPVAKNTIGEEMALVKSSLTWASTDTRVATVKSNADSSVTVTVQAKADGACAINAVTTDYVQAEADLTIYVRDYAPRLESTSLTLNSNRISGVSTGLVPSYGNEIDSVSLYEYDSKTKTYQEETSTRLTPSWSDGLLTITHGETIKNGTVKLLLKAACGNGEVYEYKISLKVSNTLPTITIKQPAKFNLHTGSLAGLTVTAKNTAVTNVEMDEETTASFDWAGFDPEGGVLSLNLTEDYCSGGKLDAKLDILVYLEDYKDPVRETVTVSTTTTSPSITLKQSTKFNLFYKDSEALVKVTAKNLTVKDVVLKPESTDSFQGSFDAETGMLAIGFTDKYIAGEVKLDTKADLLVYLEGYNVPITKSITISTVTTKPSLSLTASSSIINTAIASEHSTSFRIWNKTEKKYLTVDASAVDAGFVVATVEGDSVKLTLTEEEGKTNKGGTATITVQEDNWMGSIKLTHKVTVQTTLPVPALGTSTLKLNRIFTEQQASTTVKLNQSNLHIGEIAFEPVTGKAATLAEAEKIDFCYEDGMITAFITDEENAPKNGTYEFRYVVTLTDGTVLPAKTFKVTVHSTVPGVKLKSSTLKLNTVLQSYGETAETAVSLTSGTGYTLVGLEPAQGYDYLQTGFNEETGTLSVSLTDSGIKAQKYTVKLYPVVRHEETEQEVTLPGAVTLTVQVHKTLPSLVLAGSTLKLNRIFTSQTAATAVSLDQKRAGIGGIEFVSAAKAGSAARTQAEKISLEYDPESGSITASIPDGENAPKNGTYEFRCYATLTDGTELSAKTLKVNVHSTVPGVTLKSSTLKLNKYLGAGYARRETAVSLTKGTGYELVDMLLPDDWSGDDFDLNFAEGVVSVQLRNDEAASKKHTVLLTPVLRDTATGQEIAMSTQVKLTVQVYSAKPAVTVSAKGKLDTMDPESAIAYTVTKISDAAGAFDGVHLEGTDAELFCVDMDQSGAKPVVTLTMAEGAEAATNKTYKLRLVFSLCGQDIPVSISFKVSQSSLKFVSAGTLPLYQFQTSPLTCTVALSAPDGAKLDEISLSSKTSAAFLRAMGTGSMTVEKAEDGRSAQVSFQVQNPGWLTYGKSYTVYLDITPENNAVNVNPTQLKLTVKTCR